MSNDRNSGNTFKIKSTSCLSDVSNGSVMHHYSKWNSYQLNEAWLKSNYQSLKNQYPWNNLFVPHHSSLNKNSIPSKSREGKLI